MATAQCPQTRADPRRWTWFLLFLTVCRVACALDPNRSIGEFFHTAWTVGEGGPSGLTSIAQTSDGYLWLGTQTGLIRFDGVRFQVWAPTSASLPSNDIAALMATPDGGLWIGFSPIGAAFIKGNKVVVYGQQEGLPPSPIYAFGQDSDGTIWAGTMRGPRRLEGSRWRTVGSDWGFPDERADRFFLDHHGTFWISTLDGLFSLAPHTRIFQAREAVRTRELGETIRSPRVAEAKDGTLWLTERRDVLTSMSDVDDRRGPAIESDVRHILIDRDGAMWIFTYDDGIARVANPEGRTKISVDSEKGDVEHFTEKDGLSDNRIMAAMEDREGNIWVATRSGLDRFRARNVVPGPFPYGSGEQDLALATDQDGAIWAGNLDQPLMRLWGNSISLIGGPQRITCEFRDPDGSIWFGGEGLLERLTNGHFQSVALPADIQAGHFAIQAITLDHHGDLWVGILQNGAFRLHENVWTHGADVAALPKRTPIVLWTSPDGRIWFGYAGGDVAVLDGNALQKYSYADGLRVGTVTAIGGAGEHVLVGGLSGIALFDGKRFHMIATEADFSGVSGILEMPNGDLWLNQANGIAHIPAAEVAATEKDTHHHPAFELFDMRDGVPGVASPLRPLPSEILASDGRIWMSGTNGTSWIDPTRIYRNPVAPPVSIESIVADGRQFAPASQARLMVLPSNLRIDYTALSLSIPERVRFRYQMENFDKAWQDAGTRRTAFYTRLGPGRYRFHVIACNNDGVWNAVGASVEIVVPPAFFQTFWFKALCAAVLLAALCMLYLRRMRQVNSEMQARLKERLGERERIARELHDTLLQGIQSTILHFQAATNQLSPDDPARGSFEAALDSADQVIVEGRDRVRDLRSDAEAADALPQLLSLAGEELARDNAQTVFQMSIEGTLRELHPVVRDEAYRIGREALLNAFNHAGARTIKVKLCYWKTALELRCSDDGRGVDPGILRLGGRPGHWGLTGMRERADKIGARLKIVSRPGFGTEIELSVPASVAYRVKSTVWFSRWLRRNRIQGG